MSSKSIRTGMAIGLAGALYLAVPAGTAAALVCSATHLFPASEGELAFTDCSGSTNYYNNSPLLNHDAVMDGPFQGGSWVSDIHFTFAEGTRIGQASFTQVSAGDVDWLTSVSDSTLSFVAPSASARLDPGDSYEWIIFLLDDIEGVTIEYTMDVPEPTPFALLLAGLAGLGPWTRRRSRLARGRTAARGRGPTPGSSGATP